MAPLMYVYVWGPRKRKPWKTAEDTGVGVCLSIDVRVYECGSKCLLSSAGFYQRYVCVCEGFVEGPLNHSCLRLCFFTLATFAQSVFRIDSHIDRCESQVVLHKIFTQYLLGVSWMLSVRTTYRSQSAFLFSWSQRILLVAIVIVPKVIIIKNDKSHNTGMSYQSWHNVI